MPRFASWFANMFALQGMHEAALSVDEPICPIKPGQKIELKSSTLRESWNSGEMVC
jgi:hypothetical protein